MGYGSYNASDWKKLRSSRGISSDSKASSLFRGDGFKEKYDPRFINMRESCDSSDSPRSTPIILGFDVTYSMGYLAEEIATNSLNRTILEIYDKQPVTDPHVMCAAFTGVYYKNRISEEDIGCPLQVTQYEADIRVVEQLLDLRIPYGGNRYSYDALVWYFASRHTKIDCFEKRRKKGFVFCIGDEIINDKNDVILDEFNINMIFNDKDTGDLTSKELFKEVSEKYEVFHIITGDTRAVVSWNKLIPGRVAYINEDNIRYLSEVITSIMQMTNGMKARDAIRQWSEEAQPVVEKALEKIKV